MDPMSAGGRFRVEQWGPVLHSTTFPVCARAAALPFSTLGKGLPPDCLLCCLLGSISGREGALKEKTREPVAWTFLMHSMKALPALCEAQAGKQNSDWLCSLSDGAGQCLESPELKTGIITSAVRILGGHGCTWEEPWSTSHSWLSRSMSSRM